MSNHNIVLIAGRSASGKSASLMGLQEPEGVMYLNCETNKALPFPNKFDSRTITDPMQVFDCFEEAQQGNHHTIIIDTYTYLMNMFETLYVNTAPDTRKAWGEYAQFHNMLTQQYMANSDCRIGVLAHTGDVENEDGLSETRVKVKGSIMNVGVESAFNTVLVAKAMPIKKLRDNYENDLLLPIGEGDTDEEGYRHVFQTRRTGATCKEQIRSPMRMWSKNETFIDNDLEAVFQRHDEYYNV